MRAFPERRPYVALHFALRASSGSGFAGGPPFVPALLSGRSRAQGVFELRPQVPPGCSQ